MAKKDLKPWLKSKDRNYEDGVKLFKELKVDPKKNAFFDTEEPQAIHKNMLITQLSNYDRVYNQDEKKADEKNKPAILDAERSRSTKTKPSKNLKISLEEAANVEKQVDSGRLIIDKNNRISYDDLTPELKQAYDDNGKLYSEIKTLHANLKAVPAGVDNDTARKDLVNQMLEKQKVTQANWAKLDAAYPADGKAPEPPKPEQPTKPSGSLTKVEIEAIIDPVIRAQSKDMRIDTNLKYVRLNRGNEKKAAKVKERVDELVAWKIDYEARIKTDKASDTGE